MKKYIKLACLAVLSVCIINISAVSATEQNVDDLVKQYQIKKESAQKKIAQDTAKRQAKESADKADCEQAKAKANERTHEIKKSLGLNPDEKNLYNSFFGEVIDFSNKGVFICNSSVWQMVFSGGETCTDSDRILIHTTDDYVNGQMFKDNGFLYIRVENYKYTTVMGSTNSVPAYKPTKFKASEIDYRTYLQDKSIEQCK